MKELLKLYVSSKKHITETQYDYIKNDDDLLLYYLAAGNEHDNNFVDIKNFVNTLNENKQKFLIKKQGKYIRFIDEPSEQLQLAAVEQEGAAIKHIIDKGITPSEQVQLAAVKQNAGAIDLIENPSENVQLAAVQQYGGVIFYIYRKGITPSEQVQLAAVQQNRSVIKYIKNLYPSVINYYNQSIK